MVIFSVEEVLGAEDKELNAWASLRKTCQYRGAEEERKDFHVYRNKVRSAVQQYSLIFSTIFLSSVERHQVEEEADAVAV